MTILTVEIDQEKDLPVLRALLHRLDLKYHLDDEDDQISDAEMEAVNAGLADLAAGRVHTMDQVKAIIDQQIEQFRDK